MNYILNMSYVLLNAALVSLQLTRVIDLDLLVRIVRQVSFFFFFFLIHRKFSILISLLNVLELCLELLCNLFCLY
jgi:hypothetical protein